MQNDAKASAKINLLLSLPAVGVECARRRSRVVPVPHPHQPRLWLSALMRKVVLLLCVAMPLASASPALPSSLSSSSIEDHDAAWATLHSAFRRLQAAVSPDSKEGVSIWTSAKRFFGSRERIKSKLSGAPAATSMPKDFGLGYKHMLEWYCAKGEQHHTCECGALAIWARGACMLSCRGEGGR